ncbi:MAG: hypothetical protein FWD11_12085 [Micrococcales bacterium]|nr:hypothetical protein [Micrococcales bacterium]
MSIKVRRTVTLDPEVVSVLDQDPDGFSSTVNAILSAEVARRARRIALADHVSELDAQFGPADPAEVERFARWLQ